MRGNCRSAHPRCIEEQSACSVQTLWVGNSHLTQLYFYVHMIRVWCDSSLFQFVCLSVQVKYALCTLRIMIKIYATSRRWVLHAYSVLCFGEQHTTLARNSFKVNTVLNTLAFNTLNTISTTTQKALSCCKVHTSHIVGIFRDSSILRLKHTVNTSLFVGSNVDVHKTGVQFCSLC